MKENSDRKTPQRREDDRILQHLLDSPERLRERLILAIALAPPKSKRSTGRRTARSPGI